MEKNKKIAILGAGKTGLSSYNHYKKLGFEVLLWDETPSVVEKLKSDYNFVVFEDWDFATLDFIIVSPGIALEYPKKHFVLKQSQKFNIKIYCDVELFIKENPQIKYIAITGTNGKSTITTLIQYIVSNAGERCTYAGNIGFPVFEINPSDFDYIVLELSSYQIDLMNYIHFNCIVLSNIQEDHIDHHGSFENYKHVKYRIFENQTNQDIAIIAKELVTEDIKNSPQQKVIVKMQDGIDEKSIYCSNTHIVDNNFSDNKNILNYDDLVYLKGEHNYLNISFAYSVAKFLNIDDANILKGILSFKGLKHRQNNLGTKNGVIFINDSKATNQESTLQAIKAYVSENYFSYLILGGVAKSDHLNVILPYLSYLKGIFLIGASSEVFSDFLTKHNINFELCGDLKTATAHAYKKALADKSSDINKDNHYVVLFSPACASFDQFKSFEHRGDYFLKIIEEL